MLRSHAFKVALIVLFALLLGYYDLPNQYQTIPGTPSSVQESKIHLGLDLQGGSQLDYKVDLRKVPEADRASIVEGVKNVINKRVNALGVSEPNIYTSTIGNEEHLIVELAGVKDLEEAKRVVGKTIQLEFKERREKQDPAHKENIRKLAQSTLQKVLAKPEEFSLIAQEEAQASPGSIRFQEPGFQFSSEISDKKLADAVLAAKPGTLLNRVLEVNEGYTFQDGQLVPNEGFAIAKVIEKRDTGALDQDEKRLEASHIVVAYRGADKAAETVTRTKPEAKTRAEELLKQLQEGKNFQAVAKESSDETGAKDSGGKLSNPIEEDAKYAEPLIEAALKLTKVGELSLVTEAPDGFHIIRADNLTEVKYLELFFSAAPDPWQETGLTGEHFMRADVQFDDFLRPMVAIKFNEEGGKLFETITERNIEKPIAIFVGGNKVSSPDVKEKISGGQAVITGKFSVKQAQEYARDLNTGAIPAPVVLAGQYTIGASLGEEALDKSVQAGVIGIVLLVVFMLLYYRLPGLVAVLALSLYTAILLFLIKSELPVALSLGVAVLIFGSIVYTILKSQEGGWEKFISFILGCFVLFFVTFLLSGPIVLTLAGVAGVILSVGMAVDANVLIFERMKEELRAGRPLSSAIEVGFQRAWSSIRDSNFSSLITCAILFYFGTSIIQGFAFNLAAGILVSMFTAITVTRTLLFAFMKTRLGENLWLWGMSKHQAQAAEPKSFKIMERRKIWFGASGAVLIVSLISLIVFRLNLGIDFRGGTLLDLSFEKPVTTEQLRAELQTIETELNKDAGNTVSASSAASTLGGEALESGTEPLRLSNARIVPSEEKRFILHLEHIDSETHDELLVALQSKLGSITENRFTTIGPVVGETLKRRAVMAVVVAMIAIILYIAFAFRKVPKKVSPWKFGVCAIVALLHDVLIPVGVFALFGFEIDALFITAILTVLGFSVHDTIVVFDRIRENLKYQGREESFDHVVNKSVTQTIARSINTSLTVLITLAALLIFGSSSIFHFVLVLLIGIAAGTYSSIFIASPLLALWQRNEKR